MKVNIPGKENKKNYTKIFSLVKVILDVAYSLPKEEKERLRQALRQPVHAILNNRIDYSKKYAELTMRRYYTVNVRSCAEIRAALDIALLKDYITRKLREQILVYVINVENLSVDVMNQFYVKDVGRKSKMPVAAKVKSNDSF